ncbi:MAG: hypothetical protein ACMUIS_08725 [bacterium]
MKTWCPGVETWCPFSDVYCPLPLPQDPVHGIWYVPEGCSCPAYNYIDEQKITNDME